MRIWRCVHRDFVRDAWSGEGAGRYGGRWNHPGRAMVYASEHAALAVLEILVGNVRSVDLVDWRLLSAEVPDEFIAPLAPGSDGRERGGAFLDGGGLAARVPSVVVPGDNVLLNPVSPDWSAVRLLGKSRMDPRLWS